MTGATSPRSWRPDEVRRRDFTVRFRGFDPNEVRGFLNAVADDLARLHEQLTGLTQDNTRLRQENGQLTEDLAQVRTELQQTQYEPQEHVTDQAVLLLSQAQALADQLIDEGMQSARDLMQAARSHQREIIDPGSLEAVAAAAVGDKPRTDASANPEIDDVRMFAKVAQVQFKAVLDALNEQVNRLGAVSGETEEEEPTERGRPSRAPAPAHNNSH